MNTGAVNQAAASAAAETAQRTSKKTEVSGRKVGNPQLSEKAAKYYEQLKAKFGNMEFVLVSKDMKEQAEANAAKYGSADRTVVLIDEEKIERMAEDEDYRKQYESLITSAAAQLSQMKSGLSADNGVTSYGIKINDNGTASYFAVIDKSLAAQKERIEKKAEKKAEDKKTAAREAEKERTEKQRADRAEKNKTEKTGDDKKTGKKDEVTVTANSVEELLSKINMIYYEALSDNVRTEAERQVGQHFDMNV